MIEKKHALLSASASQRWLNCTPSARLGQSIEDTSSSYATEGTCAHELGEYKLRCALGEDLSQVADIRDNLEYYDSEMEDATDEYVNYILEQYANVQKHYPHPQVLTEQRVNFSKYVPEGFGTCDCIIVSEKELIVCDLKYGKGLQVNAEDNTQMMLYALGALEMFDSLYDIESITMTIIQPRRSNISSQTITKEALQRWALETLVPAATLAFAGGGDFNCGEWCQFCKVKHNCRARAERNLELAKHEFALPPLLEASEIASILTQVDDLVSWASNVKDFALIEAMKGVKFNGFKVVEGRSNRRYTNDTAVADTVAKTGLDPFEHKLLGITAMEKLLSKKRFTELLGGLVEKPTGKPTLVPTSDKRQEINIMSAADDFATTEN